MCSTYLLKTFVCNKLRKEVIVKKFLMYYIRDKLSYLWMHYMYEIKLYTHGNVVLNLFFGMFTGSFATSHGYFSPYNNVWNDMFININIFNEVPISWLWRQNSVVLLERNLFKMWLLELFNSGFTCSCQLKITGVF